MVAIQNLTKTFAPDRSVLRDLSLEIQRGDFVVLLGPSGCGKTTLLRLIAGLETPSCGTVVLAANARRDLAYVFQEPHLLPWKNVWENVALPWVLRREKVSQERLTQTLAKVGLLEAKDLLPHQLSGGMRMRVSLARALVTSPQILLLDEPFAALDELTRFRLEEELRQLWAEAQMTIVFVTHSVTEAIFLGNRCLVLSPRGQGVQLNLEVPLPTQRTASLRQEPAFVQYLGHLSAALAKEGME